MALKEQTVLFYGDFLHEFDDEGVKTIRGVIRNKINEQSIGIQIMLPQSFYQHTKLPDFIAQCWWVARLI